MTTFKQFLESENPQTLKELIDKMSPGYLGRTGGQLMYRGMKNISEFAVEKIKVIPPNGDPTDPGDIMSVYKIKTQTNRTPLDSPLQLHVSADSWFEKEFGHKFRSSGLFVTSSPNSAYYGPAYAVFPIGKWSYVWSLDIGDLYDGFSEVYKEHFGKWPNLQSITKSEVHQTLELMNFTNNSLDKALNTKNEIMIDCNEYLAVRKELLPSGTRWLEN